MRVTVKPAGHAMLSAIAKYRLGEHTEALSPEVARHDAGTQRLRSIVAAASWPFTDEIILSSFDMFLLQDDKHVE